MIIECEKCKSKFNLDESLLETEGSKVRCSICKTVFAAYPPEEAPVEESALDQLPDEGLEEIVDLDSHPALEERGPEPTEEGMEVDFERALEEELEEEVEETVEAVSLDELPDLEEEEKADMGEAIDRAVMIEEEVTREDAEKRILEIPEEDEEAAEAVPSKKRPGRSRVLSIILVFIFLLLGGGGAVFFLAPDLIPDSIPFLKPTKKQEIPDRGVSRLSFNEVKGSFIRSDEAGQLFVVKGIVTNNYPAGRRFISIKGALLDDKGQEIRTKLIYAGNIFTEKQIKEMPIKELGKGLRNRLGKGRMNFNIKPGGAIPFMIIFENLPENLSEFTVEAVSSSPVK